MIEVSTPIIRSLDRDPGLPQRPRAAPVDKFVGDEIIGIFVPSLATEAHARRGVDAALALLHATGHGTAYGPWVPIGVGVNTGVAYVGSIGDEVDTELTAMGDIVNATARLASVAGAGEILVTASSAAAAGLGGSLEHRTLELKGKTETVEVVVLGPRALVGPTPP